MTRKLPLGLAVLGSIVVAFVVASREVAAPVDTDDDCIAFETATAEAED